LAGIWLKLQGATALDRIAKGKTPKVSAFLTQWLSHTATFPPRPSQNSQVEKNRKLNPAAIFLVGF